MRLFTSRFVHTAVATAAMLSLPALLHAQGHCQLPTHLATQEPFQSTHFNAVPGQNNLAVPPIPQALPANYRGHLTVCNLTANADLLVSQIDYKLRDDGSLRFNWGPAPGVPGGPGLIGQTVTIDVYSTPTTWQGNWNTPSGLVPKVQVPPGPGSPWTHVATGTLTVAPYYEHSLGVFTTPFTVPVGTNGYAIVIGPVMTAVPHLAYQQPPYALHPSFMISTFAPGVSPTASDQFLSITNQNLTSQAFVSFPPVDWSAVLDFHYTVGAGAAYSTRYAAGCYDRSKSFYQEFAPGSFDLANTSLRLSPSGGSYAVSATTAAIVPPTSAPLTNASNGVFGDDNRTATKPLGFTFPYPGGSTSSVVITSNGNIFLDPANSGSQNGTYEIYGVSGFLKGQPQLAALWTNLDPGASGDVFLDIDLSGTVPVAYVTWLAVAEGLRPAASNTFQVAMFGDGNVEFRYGAIDFTLQAGLTGFNAGFASHEPGNRDLSTAVPFVAGDGVVPPTLSVDARPRIGTTPNMTLGDLPADTGGVVMFGVPILGVNLFWAGMPGCVQRVVPLTTAQFQATGTTATVPLQIPSLSILRGIRLTAQSFVLSPGSNVAGRTISNPICLKVGT